LVKILFFRKTTKIIEIFKGANMFKTVNSVCPKDCFGSCSLEVEVEKGKVVKVRGNRNSPVNQGRICVKGINYPNMVYGSDRLLYPLQRIGKRGKGEFERISWEQALDTIYEKLKNLRGQYGPESVLYYQRFANLGVVKNCAYSFWYQFGGFTSTYGGLCDSAAQEAINLIYSDFKFTTSTGKIEFYSQQMKDRWGQNPLPFYYEPKENKYSSPELYAKYPLTFISAHALNQMNSQFSSREISQEEPFIWINPEDAKNRGINDGEKVKVYNERGSIILKTIITEKVPPGIVHTYFGWWDGVHQANLNKLTGEYISDIGYGTAFHNCLVEIQKKNGEKNRRRFSVLFLNLNIRNGEPSPVLFSGGSK
jgi:anaerobic selenocysteine-containing dehydrogenase